MSLASRAISVFFKYFKYNKINWNPVNLIRFRYFHRLFPIFRICWGVKRGSEGTAEQIEITFGRHWSVQESHSRTRWWNKETEKQEGRTQRFVLRTRVYRTIFMILSLSNSCQVIGPIPITRRFLENGYYIRETLVIVRTPPPFYKGGVLKISERGG